MIRPIDFNGPFRGTWVGFYRGWYGWTNATNLPDFFYSINVFNTSKACWGIYCSSIFYFWSLLESLVFWPILFSFWFCPSSLNFYITEPNEGVDAEYYSYPLMTGGFCCSSSELSSQSLKAFMSLSNCYLEFLYVWFTICTCSWNAFKNSSRLGFYNLVVPSWDELSILALWFW